MTETVAAEAPSAGTLSIDDAASALQAGPTEVVEVPEEQEEEAPALDAPSEETPSEAEPAAEEEPGADTPTEEPAAETPEPAIPAIEAPQFWDADAKAAFAAFTPDQQRIVADQAKAQNAAAGKAIEDAAQARKAAEGQASKVTQLAEQLNAFLPKAIDTFKGKWADHDWDRLSTENPAQYVADERQFKVEQEQLRTIAVQADEANRLELQRYQAAELDTLSKIAPIHKASELVDPKTAPQTRMAVATYLASNGIDPALLARISAVEMVIAYKAMKLDEAETKALAAVAAPKPAPKPATSAPKPASGAVRPTAAPAQAPTRQRSVDTARAALDKSGSVDDAVALLLLAQKG